MKLHELLDFEDIVIQCHDNPDADALASGFALYWYFYKNGKKAQFIYRGQNQIRKSNLMIMLEKLHIPVEYAPDFDREPDLLVTVDCQYGQRNVTMTPAKTIAVIDHHQQTVEIPALSEIRSSVGSCSTILWDMIRAEGLSTKDQLFLSTALYYGLYTDTNKLSEVSHPLDRDMLDALTINRSIITEMGNSNITLKELLITGRAILSNEYFPNHHYMIIEADPCDPNILGVISDFALETAAVDVCLAYYVSCVEVKFSVRSCIKEVHANELAAFLSEGFGGGGGHIYKAGGSIRPEKLDIPEGSTVCSVAHDLLHQRMSAYFDRYEIIYAKDTLLDLSDMGHYKKHPQEIGAVHLTDIFPEGTIVLIRTLEGDVNVTIKDEHYLMIGVEGEIYPIKSEKFKRSYDYIKDGLNKEFEYSPTIKNATTGEVRSVLDSAVTVISKDTSGIYAKPLDHSVKVFTAWDEEKYYTGNVGDYIAVREDDPHDIYVIKGRLFDQLYDPITQ